MKIKALLITTLLTLNLSALSVGEVPKDVSIEGENGGLVAGDGAAWSSSTIKERVLVMFYVDPDEKDTNNAFSDALKAEAFDRAKYGSIAVINLAATWKPNFVIEGILKDKQIEFPDTIYVKDKSSILVKEWELEDDASNILIFSKESKLLFYKSGKLTEEEIANALTLVKENM